MTDGAVIDTGAQVLVTAVATSTGPGRLRPRRRAGEREEGGNQFHVHPSLSTKADDESGPSDGADGVDGLTSVSQPGISETMAVCFLELFPVHKW